MVLDIVAISEAGSWGSLWMLPAKDSAVRLEIAEGVTTRGTVAKHKS
jgi:hypothetical protein